MTTQFEIKTKRSIHGDLSAETTIPFSGKYYLRVSTHKGGTGQIMTSASVLKGELYCGGVTGRQLRIPYDFSKRIFATMGRATQAKLISVHRDAFEINGGIDGLIKMAKEHYLAKNKGSLEEALEGDF